MESVFSCKLWRSLLLAKFQVFVIYGFFGAWEIWWLIWTEKKCRLIIQIAVMDWKIQHLANRNFHRQKVTLKKPTISTSSNKFWFSWRWNLRFSFLYLKRKIHFCLITLHGFPLNQQFVIDFSLPIYSYTKMNSLIISFNRNNCNIIKAYNFLN